MSDENKTSWVDEPGAGQSPQVSKAEPSKATPDLQQLPQAEIDRIADAILERQRRADQSKRDKLEAARQKQVANVKRVVPDLTPDQERALGASVTLDDEPLQVQSSPSTPAQAKTPETDTAADWKIQTRDELYTEYGLKLEKGDPEVDQVDTSTPTKMTRTLDAALQAKKARVEQEAVNRSTRAPATPTQGGPANPIANIKDPTELMRMGLRRK